MPTVKINRNINDLHPEDQLNRLRLLDWMLEERTRQGLSDKDLAGRVGHHSSWAHGVLTTTTWRVATLQKMIRALGYTLTFNIKTDLVAVPIVATPENPNALTYAERYANSPTISNREEAARMDLSILAKRLRQAANLTPGELGKRLNCESSSVNAFESAERPYYLLVTAQRFFRALGAELWLVLVKQEDSGQQRIFTAPQGRWPSISEDVVNIVQLPHQTLIWNTNAPETVVSFPAEAWKAWLKAND